MTLSGQHNDGLYEDFWLTCSGASVLVTLSLTLLLRKDGLGKIVLLSCGIGVMFTVNEYGNHVDFFSWLASSALLVYVCLLGGANMFVRAYDLATGDRRGTTNNQRGKGY